MGFLSCLEINELNLGNERRLVISTVEEVNTQVSSLFYMKNSITFFFTPGGKEYLFLYLL